MKSGLRALGYSIAASAFLAAGAFALSAVWLQVINPALAAFEEPRGTLWYVVGTSLALALLSVAWLLNIKGIKAR